MAAAADAQQPAAGQPDLELTAKLFDSVQEFDADKNGFIDRDEFLAYLQAV
eukprot:SAG22_NODE_20180_length_268_cov_0.248521_1_plen_50_part_01